MAQDQYTMGVIGRVSCSASAVEDVPSEGLPSTVIIDERFRSGLQGLDVGDDVYVVTVFDRADGSTMVGSRGTAHENGAFSIRSSARPNRIGMTLARLVEMDDCRLSFDWLDFADGTPVIDLKRYNWRWEVIPGTRHLDRRHFEGQIAVGALQAVLERAAAKFHGERCSATFHAAVLAARLSQEHFIGDPAIHLTVTGDRHLAEALQVLFGATVGNGRLGDGHGAGGPMPTVVLSGAVDLIARLVGGAWEIRQVGS